MSKNKIQSNLDTTSMKADDFLFEVQKSGASIDFSWVILFLLLHVKLDRLAGFGVALVQPNSSTTTTKMAFIFKLRCSVQLCSECSLSALYSFTHYTAAQKLSNAYSTLSDLNKRQINTKYPIKKIK